MELVGFQVPFELLRYSMRRVKENGCRRRVNVWRGCAAATVGQSLDRAGLGGGLGTHPIPKEEDTSLMDSVQRRKERAQNSPLSICVLGASGDLAKKKTFPAIFSLFYHGLLPKDFQVWGYARSAMTDEEFRDLILGTLTCRVIDGEKCSQKMEEFLPRCFYHRGSYDADEGFISLNREISARFEEHLGSEANRLFYLAIPPSVFQGACRGISDNARATRGWTRVVVEKPFGRDSESYAELSSSLGSILSEEEIYRIDHYLGKELVQNINVLRFANSIFEPLWNRNYVKSVQVSFSEDFGVEGRAGYFDNIGIIRDIMQNHLLQVVACLAMEPPVSLHAEDIRDEKVKVLRSIRPLRGEDFVTGQYVAANGHGGYLDGDGVSESSRTPTYAACVLSINNARWDGVPFLMRAGKGLSERKAEIRIQFKQVPGGLFPVPHLDTNELVIRVQPDEAIYMKIVSKVPGLTSRLEEARLNLFLKTAWEESKDIPDAYERLILDVIQGEKSLFIRDDELDVAWKIFTPALLDLENGDSYPPYPYEFGSKTLLQSEYLAARLGVRWSND
mmetsp:Transcript_2719/g.4928  ORF Transcript_2719/g.4928 Transcript_2719/m.4928 type:complete len:562 (-) Transcript_2719:2337-4022(-)